MSSPQSIVTSEAGVQVVQDRPALPALYALGKPHFNAAPGDSHRILRNVFSKAVKKSLRRLLGREHGLRVQFEVAEQGDFRGQVFFPGERFMNRELASGEYAVLICAGAESGSMSWDSVRQVAAHEARHIWQHATGLLRYLDPAGEAFEWEGVRLKRASFSYLSLPFEIDARAYAGQSDG